MIKSFGSSPQVRGARSRIRLHHAVPRLIPAGAGRTRRGDRRATPRRAHPRRCGAHSTRLFASIAAVGSSPQVRGARSRIRLHHAVPRLIPAGAGHTAAENSPEQNAVGSSPQVRGAPLGYLVGNRPGRLIPAGAGRTRPPYRRPHPWPAHPRRCGAHMSVDRFLNINEGSSPQVRGAPPVLVGLFRLCRLIPAGAGRTSPASARPERYSAHPRRCGAHSQPLASIPVSQGSSPQVRGAPRCDDTIKACYGLIPAGAGRTARSQCLRGRGTAHPRRCGAHDGSPIGR